CITSWRRNIRSSSPGPTSNAGRRCGGSRSASFRRRLELGVWRLARAQRVPASLRREVAMIGVSLSRWTMSYFAAALLSLVAAEALMTLGYGFPHAALRAPETLILVHVVAIGWLSLLMCGALFQFVPVLVAQPLHSNMLPLPTLVLLVAGLAALILGFLQLAGQVAPAPPFFAFAAVLLGAGFALVLWNLARTLIAART